MTARSIAITTFIALASTMCGSPARTTPVAPRASTTAAAVPPAPAASEVVRLEDLQLPVAPPADPKRGLVKDGPSGPLHLMFIDGGAALLIDAASGIALVDPHRRVVVDSLGLNSVSVPDRSGNPVQGAHREQSVYGASWQWDPAHRTVVGGVCIGGWGDVTRGLSVWTPSLPAPPVPVARPAGADSECRPLAMSGDASAILARTAAASVQLIAVKTARSVGPAIALAHDPKVGAFSPDGSQFATGGEAGDVELYDVGTRKLATLAPDHNHAIRALAFDPVRARLIVVGDVEVIAWDLQAGRPTHVADAVTAVAFRSDGKWLALGEKSNVAIVDGATFQPVQSIAVAEAVALAFSPDSTQLAVSTYHELAVRDLDGAAPPHTPVPAVDRTWFDQLRPLPVPPPPREPPFTRDGVVEGRVTETARPVAGAEVRLTPSNQDWPHARALAPVVKRTDATGKFRFTGLPRIDWSLTVAAQGMTLGGWFAQLRDRPSATGGVSLSKAVTLDGVVVGPDGRPVANAHVMHAQDYGSSEVEVITGRDGKFTIDHLAQDTVSYETHGYDLQAWGPDGAVGVAAPSLKKLGKVSVTIRLVSANDASVVRLKVTDETGAPIADADVAIPAGNRSRRTDANGMFSTLIEPRFAGYAQIDVQVVVANRVYPQHIAWPPNGVVPITINRATPPGTLLPLACTLYREAIERLMRCDRVPAATRDALKSEFDLAAATWATHPENADFTCDLGQQQVTETAKLCR